MSEVDGRVVLAGIILVFAVGVFVIAFMQALFKVLLLISPILLIAALFFGWKEEYNIGLVFAGSFLLSVLLMFVAYQIGYEFPQTPVWQGFTAIAEPLTEIPKLEANVASNVTAVQKQVVEEVIEALEDIP